MNGRDKEKERIVIKIGRDLLIDCHDPINDISNIRNRATGVYLSLVDDDSISDEILACLEDVEFYANRVQRWFIENQQA